MGRAARPRWYWVAVDVAEFFDALWVGEDVEVVVAGEPERFFGEFVRDGTLDDGECHAQWFDWGLGYEEVDVFWHDDVADDVKVVAFADGFQGFEEDLFCVGGGQVGGSVVTTEGDEVEVSGLLSAF